MSEWKDFLSIADDWIISYYSSPLTLAKSFMVGHAVELYLKATYAKQTNDTSGAIRFGHNIKGLWDACKTNDSAFMPDYHFRDSIFSNSLFAEGVVQGDWFSQLSPEDYAHYVDHQGLYLIAWLLPDLKYAHAPPKRGTAARFALLWPDPYWADFFSSIRIYLDYPPLGSKDNISFYVEDWSREDRNRFDQTCFALLKVIVDKEITSP